MPFSWECCRPVEARPLLNTIPSLLRGEWALPALGSTAVSTGRLRMTHLESRGSSVLSFGALVLGKQVVRVLPPQKLGATSGVWLCPTGRKQSIISKTRDSPKLHIGYCLKRKFTLMQRQQQRSTGLSHLPWHCMSVCACKQRLFTPLNVLSI